MWLWVQREGGTSQRAQPKEGRDVCSLQVGEGHSVVVLLFAVVLPRVPRIPWALRFVLNNRLLLTYIRSGRAPRAGAG